MLRVVSELCDVLKEKVDAGKRQGVSRFITEDLPESVIKNLHLTKDELPDLGVDLIVFVLDNASQLRWTPGVSGCWNFVTEDDLAAARTELADSSTCILVVVPPGRNLAATMDSTTRKIDGVFQSVALSVANFIGLNNLQFLRDVLNEIAQEEGIGDPEKTNSIRWGALFDLDGLTEGGGLTNSVMSRLGLLSGTTEENWRRSKNCWREVANRVLKAGIYDAVESWVMVIKKEEQHQSVERALRDWRDHIVDCTNGDSTLFFSRPWGVSRHHGETPSWYGVLDHECWSFLIDEKGQEDVVGDLELEWPQAVCQIHKSKTEKWEVYGADGLVFDESSLTNDGEWLFGDEVVNAVEVGDGVIRLQLPNSSMAKELKYYDVATGAVSTTRKCLGLNDQFPCVILMNNGVVKSWRAKGNIFKVKLNGVGNQKMSVVLHTGWSVVDDKVIGIGVRTDIEGDEKGVIFDCSNAFDRDGLRFQEFDFDTDEDSELKFSLTKEHVIFNVVVEVKADSSNASYGVESVWKLLVHRNLNTKKLGSKIPQVAGELTGMMDLQLMLWKYSWGFPVIISTDTLQFRFEADDEQRNGLNSQVYSKATLTGHMDARGDQEVFREDCRKLLEIRQRLVHCLGIGRDNKEVLEHLYLYQLDGLPELLEEYLLEYARLANESESDNWRQFETVWLHAGGGKGSLVGKPSCMFLTPLHPLCIGWQYHSQLELQETLNASKGCPQAALLSPVDLPPFWGLKDNKYLPVETNLAYWRCYASDQKHIADQDEVTEFLEGVLGIEFKSMATGLKANQVESALDQVSKIFAAQTGFVISVSGDRMHSAVNDGLENWLLANCSNLGLDRNGDSPENGRSLHASIYDTRQLSAQNFGAGKLGVLANNYGVEIAYHTVDESPDMVDIAFLTSLKTSDPDLRDKSVDYCVDPLCVEGGLVRFGLSALVHGESVESSLDLNFTFDGQEGGLGRPLSLCLKAVQDALSGGVSKSYLYAPDPELMRELLGKSEFLAVSSPLLDLDYLTGQDDMLVWQYAIPAYGESAGTNDGYFLISNTKDEYVKSMEAKLRAAGIELSESNSVCRRLISMAGQRGVLDLKRFLSGGAASVGEIGMLGAQLILDPGDYYGTWCGLLGSKTKEDFSLLVPVDPFEKRLNVLREAIAYKSHSRPDYFVIRFTGSGMFVSLVEVKWRSNIMSDSEMKCVVKNQLHGFMGFLERLLEWQDKGGLWRRAFRILLTEVTLFGLRLSMADKLIDAEVARSCMYTLGEVFANRLPIVLDPRKGRVISFAQEGANQFSDLDKDGFPEILHVSVDQMINLFDPTRLSQFKKDIGGVDLKDWFEVPESSKEVLTLEKAEVHSLASETDEGLVNVRPEKDAEWNEDSALEMVAEDSKVQNEQEPQPLPETLDSSQDEGAMDGEGICFAVGGVSGVMGEMSYDYAPSNTALTQLNMGVVGDLGTGKTQLLKALMYQIARDPSRNRGVAPKFLVLDTKRDYGDNQGINSVILDTLGAKVIRPYNMPLNIFDIRGSKEFHPMMAKANFFVDILDKIHSGIGPIQQTNLFEAIQTAFEEKGYEPGMDFSNFEAPTLKDVFEVYAANGQKDSPYSIMRQLLMNKLFVEDASQAQSFSEFFNSSVVVSLGDIASMDKPLRLALVIFLNLYRDYMLNVEKRKYVGADPQLRYVDSYVLIDEAKLIMDLDLKVLEDLLRKGREFGVGVVLSSQYLGDFKSKSMNYGEALATWFIHKVPKVTERELEQLGFQNVVGLPQKIKTLEPHHCLYKSFGCNGEVIYATPFYRIIEDEEV